MSLINPKVELQICSERKDNHYSDILKSHLTSCVSGLFGELIAIRWNNYINFIADFLYHVLTTVSGKQTLGEEYVNIIQVDSSGTTIPKFRQRLLSVILRTLFLPLLQIFNNKLMKKDEIISSDNKRLFLKSVSVNFEPLIKDFQRLNLAFFYVFQNYSLLSKRLTKIKYVKFSPLFSSSNRHDETFDFIGRFAVMKSFLNLFSRLSATVSEMKDQQKITESSLEVESNDCALCLSSFKEASVIRCGHMFCWKCIHNCLQNKLECPLCRYPTNPKDIVLLQNF